MPRRPANRPRPGRPRAGSGQLARKLLQGRLIPDQPQVADRVDEASLPVNAPWRLTVADLVDAAVRAGCHGTFDESVRVVGEDLDSHGLVPATAGASQPLFSGSPTKTGAPAMLNPATRPRFHSSVAPSACLYQSTEPGRRREDAAPACRTLDRQPDKGHRRGGAHLSGSLAAWAGGRAQHPHGYRRLGNAAHRGDRTSGRRARQPGTTNRTRHDAGPDRLDYDYPHRVCRRPPSRQKHS